MILSDRDLKARLPELHVRASNPNFQFDPDSQVRSCSIDLRLSDILWMPRKGIRIDLSDVSPLGSQVDRAFVRKHITFPAGYRLRPGEMVLGRTYEAFVIPPDLTGRLVDRSSFGRLGLSVAGLVTLINPGWSGHMPLAIVNHSPFDIILHPFIGIVQLCLHRLTEKAEVQYGAPGSGSKYVDDDGGPSRYWLDRTITALRENANAKRTTPETQAFLEYYSALLDESTRKRFGRHVGRYGPISDLGDLLEAFVKSERLRTAAIPTMTVLVGIPLALLTSWLPALWAAGWFARLFIGGLTLAAVVGLGWIAWTQFGTTIPPAELRRMAIDLRKPRAG